MAEVEITIKSHCAASLLVALPLCGSFGGSGLLCAYLFRRNPERPNWKAIIGGVIIAIALTGCLDEYHQSFTPGRSGNDPYDWLADVLGATAGALTFKRIHHRLK